MEPFLINIDLLPVNVAIYKKDNDDFTFLAFNKSAERTEHIERSLLLGRKLTEVFPGVKKFGLYDVLLRVYDSGESEIYENAFYKDNRISGWRKNHIVKLPDGTVAALYQDSSLENELKAHGYELEKELNEIKKSAFYQRALAKSEKKFKNIADTSSDWFWELDQHGLFTYSSSIIEKLLGYTDAEIIGKSPFDFMPAKEADRVSLIFKKYKDNKCAFNNLENLNIHKNGSKVILLTSAVPILNETGELTGYRGLDRDITIERKIARDLQIEKECVIKANAANLAKSNFLANMSHELRTPMHGILSFVNMGLDRPERLTTEKVLDYFGYIKTSADRLLNLLNNLLDLAKLESGKMDINIKQSSLWAVAQSCVKEQQARLDGQNQKVVYTTGNISGEGYFDDLRIAQVITNLLSNAIKFTPAGEKIEFTISHSDIYLEPQNKIISGLLFSVRDYGKGLPAGEYKLVFEKFEQGSESKVGTTYGTGLGLPISKEIIDLHHGNIWAENHPDGGAVFSFIIPVEQVGIE